MGMTKGYGMTLKKGRRHGSRRYLEALLLGTALCVATQSPAVAQQNQQRASATKTFNVAAQPLASAVAVFGRQAGIQVSLDAAAARNQQSGGVNGSLSVDAALTRLLAGTGLTYRFMGAGTVLIVVPGAAQGGQANDNSTQLAPITVQGTGQDGSNTVVVRDSTGGTKTDTPLIEVPQSVSVVTRKQIEMQNAQSVSEILRYVPGVTIETYGADPKGYDWILMRGFNAQSTSSYLDGLRQLSSSYSFFRTDPYQLQSVEVLRGPSSALYGQSDAGGLVNRVSKLPTTEPIREVEVEYGSNNRRQAAFDLGGPITDDGTFLYRLIGVGRLSDTQFDYSDGTEVKDNRGLFAPSFTWAPDADTTLTVQGDVLHDTSGGTILKFTPTDILLGDHSFNRSDQQQQTIGYRFEHRFNDTWTVRQNFRYGHVDFQLDNIMASGIAGTDLTRITRTFDESFDGVTVDNQAQADFETGALQHQLLLGFDYAYSDADVRRYQGAAPNLNIFNPVYGLSIPRPTTAIADYREYYQQAGLYAQDQITFDDSWILTAGGRYDWLTIDNHSRMPGGTDTTVDVGNFSGRVGLTYLTSFGLAPYVSYSESFVPNTGVDAAGNTFDPSVGEQWEVGVKYQPTGFDGLFSVAYFDITKSNVLTYGAAFPVAAGEVTSHGVELEGKVGLGSGWDMIASYTFTDAEITATNVASQVGKRPSLVPEHQASGWLNYTVQSGVMEGLSLGGGIRYVGSSYGDNANTVKVDAHTLVDAGISYKYQAATLSLNATNLFDKKYFTTCEDAYSCYDGDRRSVIGRIKVNF
jgi:iron complex outermembrane recepter protein